MLERYPDEIARTPAVPPFEMVLRYAFHHGNSAQTATGEGVVEPIHLNLFLQRFGPMRTCLDKARR